MVREIVKWFQTWPSKPLAWISYHDLKKKPKTKRANNDILNPMLNVL